MERHLADERGGSGDEGGLGEDVGDVLREGEEDDEPRCWLGIGMKDLD